MLLARSGAPLAIGAADGTGGFEVGDCCRGVAEGGQHLVVVFADEGAGAVHGGGVGGDLPGEAGEGLGAGIAVVERKEPVAGGELGAG